MESRGEQQIQRAPSPPQGRGQSSLLECSPWKDRDFVKGFFSSEWKEWRKTGTGTRTKLGDVKE